MNNKNTEPRSINKYKYVHLCTPTPEPYSSSFPIIATFSFGGFGNLAYCSSLVLLCCGGGAEQDWRR
ncbi:hypothetical protein RIF29_26246 [Crotalaria pallida]|uniref:Uncharacterized protein n=1 Tax=Crotalaria pallida TaxID=3830 RepID=A0AAN9I090_CROPI